MAPPTATDLRQDLYWTLWGAGQDLGFCLLAFPISTFSGALLLGLLGSLPQMRHPSLAPVWIIGLGLCVLFSVWAVFTVRSARRSLSTAGMPPREVRRRISGLWIITACLMILEGGCALGYLAITFDPDRMGSITVFGPLDRPLPLVITLTLYVLAGALLLGRNWREAQEAKSDPELYAAGNPEADKAAAWTRDIELYTARSNGGVVVMLFVIATFFLALLIASGNSGHGKWEASRLLIMSLFAFASGLSMFQARRIRRHFEAAGFSQEEVRQEMAHIWRSGGFLMIMIGAGALACVYLAFDLLTPAGLPWVLGSALVYTLTGVFLFWKNRRR